MKSRKESQGQGNKWTFIIVSAIVLFIVMSFVIFSNGIIISKFVNKNVQEINMEVLASGYSPNVFTIKQGIPVRWNIDVKQLTGCNEKLILRDYGIDIDLQPGINKVEFIPDKTGVIRWNCGMNMLQGSFLITETGEATKQQINEATPQKSIGCTCDGHA